jgi:amidase
MDLAEYAQLDAVALADLVARREITGAELADLALAAVAHVQPVLNAVVETWPAAAGADAPSDEGASHDSADSADGGSARLRGVPVLLKDLFHGAAGHGCENGSRLTAGWIEPLQAEATRRLRRAGMVPVGRTTTSEFGILGSTETLACGPTCSPWSAERIAGGSSGGAAAAVGAGIVPIATASDGGGSIRIPASACGTVGLKPSRGRVSWGPGGGAPLLGWAVKFVCTRSVRDTAAALDVLAGPLAGDPSIAPPPLRPFAAEVGADPGRLRVAVTRRGWSGRPVDPEVAAACDATAGMLSELGHDVQEADPGLDWEPFLGAMTAVWSADTAHTIDAMAAATGRVPGPDTLEGATLAMLEHGRLVTAQQLLRAQDTVNALSRQMGAFFAQHDVLLTPTLGTLPWRLGVYEPLTPLAPRELFDTWSEQECFLPAFNATGQPAISLPLHQSSDGLPIGMQLVGRFGDEAGLLRVAAQLEAAHPWADRLPPIHAGAPLTGGPVNG